MNREAQQAPDALPVEAMPPTDRKDPRPIGRQQLRWQQLHMKLGNLEEARPEDLTTQTLQFRRGRGVQCRQRRRLRLPVAVQLLVKGGRTLHSPGPVGGGDPVAHRGGPPLSKAEGLLIGRRAPVPSHMVPADTFMNGMRDHTDRIDWKILQLESKAH